MSVQDHFQELVDSLKKVLLNPPVSLAPSAPAPSPVVSSSHSQILFNSPMARPAPFSGEAEECNGFLLQCSLTIELQPQMFTTEQSRMAFVISALTGPALQWAETDRTRLVPPPNHSPVFWPFFGKSLADPLVIHLLVSGCIS